MLSTTQDWIQSYQIGQFDTIAMMDDQGILLAHNPSMPNAIGTTLNFIVDQSKVALGDVNKTFSAVSPIDGRERIYGVSKIDNIPLYIVIGYDKQQSLNEWQRRLWQTAVGFLALMIVAFLMLRNHRKVLLKQQELRRLSVTDPLTCIANRRQIMLLGENEITRALRYKTTVSVLMLDIDHFKSVNDSYGHQVGDKVIQYLAQSMVSNLRSFDIVGRLGGEEFALILPEPSSADALKIANRLREIIEQSDAAESATGKPIHITVSIGVASMKEGDPSFSNLLGKADEALYDAKSKGRNRVEFAS
jgi:diguanylate cyclase (GGDEF)-like protein